MFGQSTLALKIIYGMPHVIPSKWKDFNSSLCNLKLVGAKYFNKGVLASNKTMKIGRNSARDTTGHGTFISTIAAGNYVDEVSYIFWLWWWNI